MVDKKYICILQRGLAKLWLQTDKGRGKAAGFMPT